MEISRFAIETLASRGITRSEAHRAGRDRLEKLLRLHGFSAHEALFAAEAAIGGFAGSDRARDPLELAIGGSFGPPSSDWWEILLGPGALLERNITRVLVRDGFWPIGISAPFAAFAGLDPYLHVSHDRAERSRRMVDVLVAEDGTVSVRDFSIGNALVPYATSPVILVEKLARFLDIAQRGLHHLRLEARPRAGARLAEALGARPVAVASDAYHTVWDAEDLVILDGHPSGAAPDRTLVFARSVERLARAVEALAGSPAVAAIACDEITVALRDPGEAPAPASRGLVPVGLDRPEERGALRIERTASGVSLVQERDFGGRVLERRELPPVGDRLAHTRWMLAAEGFRGVLTDRAVNALRARGVLRDPQRAASRARLEELLAPHGVAASEPLFAFEQHAGGLCVSRDHGEHTWLGPALEIEGGVLPRNGLVPIGAFSRGLYFMAADGAILADDGVVERFVFADSWRIFLERFALGHEAPDVIPEWPARHRASLSEDVGEALARALGVPRAPELSDQTQSFWTSDDLVIWSTPAYLEFCVSPCILYADEPAVIEQALAWIQANHPELSIERSEATR
ncbi:hypothetical protein WME95_22820 [Sorangium sp. So ce327]|uniref:hypothetical protein n=1 Tax=Sorangium sp. So ce327 TaxID=3133301 RepID=UPI003F60E631